MSFGSLWIPVVVSAVAVWLVSAVLHMALKYHTADYKGLANEDAVGEVLRKGSISPGVYMIPHCADHAKLKEPAMIEKFTKGPIALITVMPSGPPAMGKNLVQWIALCLLISFTAAYIARHTLSAASDGMLVMRITGTVAFVGYAYGHLQDAIWKAIPTGNTLRAVADSVVYAVITGLAFRLLWPS